MGKGVLDVSGHWVHDLMSIAIAHVKVGGVLVVVIQLRLRMVRLRVRIGIGMVGSGVVRFGVVGVSVVRLGMVGGRVMRLMMVRLGMVGRRMVRLWVVGISMVGLRSIGIGMVVGLGMVGLWVVWLWVVGFGMVRVRMVGSGMMRLMVGLCMVGISVVVGLRMIRLRVVGMVRSIRLYCMVRRKVGRGQVGFVGQGEVISMRNAHSMRRRATVATVERCREVQISRVRVYECVGGGQGVSVNLPEEAQVSKANCRKREQQ